jgi:hypothetical protein
MKVGSVPVSRHRGLALVLALGCAGVGDFLAAFGCGNSTALSDSIARSGVAAGRRATCSHRHIGAWSLAMAAKHPEIVVKLDGAGDDFCIIGRVS